MDKGFDYLKEKLRKKQSWVNERYKYYEQKTKVVYFNENLPTGFTVGSLRSGWCSAAVNAIYSRIRFKKFNNDIFDMNSIFNQNNKDIFVKSAIKGALISGCDFVYIGKNDNGFPTLQVVEGSKATGIIDPTTNLLKEGYAILETDSMNQPTLEAYFEKGKTTFYRKGKKDAQIVITHAPYPTLVPIIYNPDAKQPFGHSRITNEMIDIQKASQRNMYRTEVSSEFYSYPQKYVLGTSQDAEQIDKFKAAMSVMLEFTKDEDGDKPVVGQFAQQSMAPYKDVQQLFAAMFAGASGLTLEDLGFSNGNPTSHEAIVASHETLKQMTNDAIEDFAVCLKNVGYIAACVRDEKSYERANVCDVEALFKPVFMLDAKMIAAIGDAAVKINMAVPGYFNKDVIERLTGIESKKQTVNLFDIDLEDDDYDDEEE